MNLNNKTKKWVKNHLITPEQQKAILAEEDRKFLPFVLMGIIWLGLFCIGLGIISLVVAHWTVIPAAVKLSGLVALLLGALGTAYYALRHERNFIFETALFFAFLMIGGGIGLIAQIFNLPVAGPQGLLLWAFLSLGIVLISKRDLLLLLWIPLFVGGIIGFMRLELLLLFFEESPIFATVLLAGILFGAIYLCHFFKNRWTRVIYKWSIALYFPVVFLGDLAMHSILTGFLISFAFLLLLLSFAVKEKRVFLFNITSFFIVLRLIFLYFQIFKNLVMSGVGFFLFGLLLLLVVGIWYWVEKRIKQNEAPLLPEE